MLHCEPYNGDTSPVTPNLPLLVLLLLALLPGILLRVRP